MVDLNFWWETGNQSIINGTDIPHQISPVLFLCSLFWPSFSLSSFFSPISFYLVSSCNCRIYKGKIGIRSSPNSGRDPGTFFFLFRKGRSLFFQFSSVQSLSRVQLCSLMDCSMPGFPVHHQFPEPIQTHVHGVGDATQPSHPLLSPSPPAFNLSQNQGLFQWVSSLHQVAKVLEFQL